MRLVAVAAFAALIVASPCAAQTVTVANKPAGAAWTKVGPIQLIFSSRRREVVNIATKDGREYRWVTRDGKYGPQLVGGNCPPLRQFVRLTRKELVYGAINPRTGHGGMSVIARSCLEAGGTCRARRIEL